VVVVAVVVVVVTMVKGHEMEVETKLNKFN